MNYQPLFNYIKSEHGVTLLETDMIEIGMILQREFDKQAGEIESHTPTR